MFRTMAIALVAAGVFTAAPVLAQENTLSGGSNTGKTTTPSTSQPAGSSADKTEKTPEKTEKSDKSEKTAESMEPSEKKATRHRHASRHNRTKAAKAARARAHTARAERRHRARHARYAMIESHHIARHGRGRHATTIAKSRRTIIPKHAYGRASTKSLKLIRRGHHR